jgi:hypothetical protein
VWGATIGEMGIVAPPLLFTEGDVMVDAADGVSVESPFRLSTLSLGLLFRFCVLKKT